MRHYLLELLSFRTPLRKMRGSSILEGAVGLLLVFTGLIVAGLLLMNSGVLIYNQEKIGFASHAAALYASRVTNIANRQADVEAQVSNIMNNLGLASASTTITIKDITVSSKPAVSVSISASLPTMLSANFGNLLPQQVQLTETAVALKPVNPMKYLVVTHPLTGQITVPLLNPTGVLPNDGLPAYEISLAGVRKLR